MSLRYLWALCLLSACAGMQHETRSAPGESQASLSDSQLNEVAGVLEQRGDVVRAEQYWQMALEQGADAETVVPKLIAAFVRDRQYRLALQHAEGYMRLHPNADALRLLTGAIYEAVGNYAAAVEQYQVVLARHTDRADIYYVLGAALLKQGSSRLDADASFRKYLELAPNGRYAERAQASLLKEMIQ